MPASCPRRGVIAAAPRSRAVVVPAVAGPDVVVLAARAGVGATPRVSRRLPPRVRIPDAPSPPGRPARSAVILAFEVSAAPASRSDLAESFERALHDQAGSGGEHRDRRHRGALAASRSARERSPPRRCRRRRPPDPAAHATTGNGTNAPTAPRTATRPRWIRPRTEPALVPSSAAIWSWVRPSIALSTRALRWASGSKAIAATARLSSSRSRTIWSGRGTPSIVSSSSEW